ncbi:hypothetical protein OFN22_32445, partial [Escherichia coli]|nr:hypothetical protein [Escherichia coli]
STSAPTAAVTLAIAIKYLLIHALRPKEQAPPLSPFAADTLLGGHEIHHAFAINPHYTTARDALGKKQEGACTN